MYFANKLQEYKKDIKLTWKSIRLLLGKMRDKSEICTTFRINNTHTSDVEKISNAFCKYFSSIGKDLASSIPTSNAIPTSYLNDRNPGSLFLAPTTPEEICKILYKTKSKSSLGPDNISTKLLKDIGPPICVPVSILVNMSISQGIVPDNMKIAKVIPVFKAQDRSELSNYRPISLLPCVSKLVERVMHKRLYSFLSANGILYQSQYGFRPNHSTTDAVTEFVQYAINTIKKKRNI